MANKNIFSSLLSTVTAIGSLSIMASCIYDAGKNAKNMSNADVYNLNMQYQFNNPLNANVLINNSYAQGIYSNINQPTNLENLGAKLKGGLKGAVASLSQNFITLCLAALGAVCNRNYIGKLCFIGSLVSMFGKNLLKKSKLSNKELASMGLNINNNVPYQNINSMTLTNAPNNLQINPLMPMVQTPVMYYGNNLVNPAYPYLPNNSPYIPYQQTMRLY